MARMPPGPILPQSRAMRPNEAAPAGGKGSSLSLGTLKGAKPPGMPPSMPSGKPPSPSMPSSKPPGMGRMPKGLGAIPGMPAGMSKGGKVK